MKICIKCLIEKSFDEFPKNKSHKDGHTNICKSCGIIYQKILRGTTDISIIDFNANYAKSETAYINSRTKICSTCYVEKLKKEFNVDSVAKDKLSSQCKECRYKKIEELRLHKIESFEKRVNKLTITHKICTKCDSEKPLECFSISRSSLDGRISYCRDCAAEMKEISELKNPQAHKDSDKRYREANREKTRESSKKYRQANLWKYKYWAAKRRAAKLKRTPEWSDLNTIKEFYKNCPTGYEVDHIIPLQGKFISGFHVLSNLQYLPEVENWTKNNVIDLDTINLSDYIIKINIMLEEMAHKAPVAI